MTKILFKRYVVGFFEQFEAFAKRKLTSFPLRGKRLLRVGKQRQMEDKETKSMCFLNFKTYEGYVMVFLKITSLFCLTWTFSFLR